MSGIAKGYDYKNVQEFYRTTANPNAYIAYKEQEVEWEKFYGEDKQKQDKERVYERLKNPPKKTADYQKPKTVKNQDRGVR